ncbi:hypothetical protein COB21_03060 [Candidatus Aerophobetes bacterium]|uniref:Uncharacterized protein n=1 Tax=Aerophobetes bacterium TaxID=2030807 RepID=A0A2A4X640_UNCAE|nr:MAG: hypothetical protein COB21_03060 [Candidatus Aerophobetes bacterium]
MGKPHSCSLTFQTLIKNYSKLQAQVVCQVRNVASRLSAATPGKFLLLQFSMSQVTQVGDSISNLISQVNSMISNSVRNQKGN